MATTKRTQKPPVQAGPPVMYQVVTLDAKGREIKTRTPEKPMVPRQVARYGRLAKVADRAFGVRAIPL